MFQVLGPTRKIDKVNLKRTPKRVTSTIAASIGKTISTTIILTTHEQTACQDNPGLCSSIRPILRSSINFMLSKCQTGLCLIGAKLCSRVSHDLSYNDVITCKNLERRRRMQSALEHHRTSRIRSIIRLSGDSFWYLTNCAYLHGVLSRLSGIRMTL